MSRTYYSPQEKLAEYCYDYRNQVWIKNGKYVRCGHPENMECFCYGREHAGETAIITEHCH
jgi:hypothetical protein